MDPAGDLGAPPATDSLAGRCAILSLGGLTAREVRASGWEPRNTEAHAELLVRGGFPELWADRSIPEREFCQAYIATYLERDLRQLLRVGSLRDFERFLRACAARTGTVLNRSELARDVGVSQTTTTEWISVLEASNQIHLLEPFFANIGKRNIGKRLVKTPKLYFGDTGLVCFLLGLTPEALPVSSMIGAVWETFLFNELRRWIDLHRPEWTLRFYRDQQQREADFVVHGPWDRVRVIDAKWSEAPRRDAFGRLDTVADLLRRAQGVHEVEVALLSRATSSHRLAKGRQLVSAFQLDRYLAD